jgi:phosphonoacetate hydrolase
MMNDVRFLRAPTLFSKFYEAGARVAMVTAKDKLRALLSAGLKFDEGRAIAFSAERADETSMANNGVENASEWLGMPVPEVYSAELSEFVFAAGIKILNEMKPDIMYLSTTDYVQHKFSPQEQGAKDFYAMFDRYLGELQKFDVAIVVTADHGMKPKHDNNKEPAVIYMQDKMDEWLGIGQARVILPITDPYVVHHGALGSFATAYLPDNCDINSLITKIASCPEILKVISKEEAIATYDLPGDRIGDIVMISTENLTIGTSKDRHDLAALKEPLRSHGGLTEQEVPFIVNKVMDLPSAPELRNFDAFFYATHAAAS